MHRRAARRLLSLVAVACAAGRAAPCAAQVDASLDAAASVVKYDGYLPSNAVEITPTVGWRSARTTVASRVTFLGFQSGNTSIQGLLTAGTFSRPIGPVRLEGAGEAGASTYASFARFAHALARVRVHAFARGAGVWAGALAGSLSRGDGAVGARGVAAGAWTHIPGGALEVSWARVATGDTAYSDVEGRARWRRGELDVEASVGVRGASRGGGHGVFGDLSAAVRLSEITALVVAGGTYPSDPVRGSIPGRFVTVGIRFTPRPSVRATWVRQIGPYLASVPAPAAAAAGAARVAVEQLDGLAVLVVRVAGARRVEVMGDFTDWQPIPLAPTGDGRYRFAVGLPPGVHRFNLRLDGGTWGVPLGAGFASDEFGGSVGVLVVP